MSLFATRWAMEPLRSVGFADIVDADGDYIPIGTGFANPARIVAIQNFTDTYLFFSLNGVDDNIVLPAGNAIFLDLCSEKTNQSGYYVAPVGQIIFVRGIADDLPAVGEVYVTVSYAAH
jgi:hypothetical protein